MKVKELIKKLKKYDKDLEVFVWFGKNANTIDFDFEINYRDDDVIPFLLLGENY